MEFNATFLIAAFSFILFVIIMNLIFYKPIEKIVNEREAFVDENFDEAKKNNLTSKKLMEQYDKNIDEANLKGKNILSEKSQAAKNKKANLILDAQKRVSDSIFNNQNELTSAFEQTKDELKPEVQNLAAQMSAKLFGDKILNNGGNG